MTHTLPSALTEVVATLGDAPAYSDRHGPEAERAATGWRTISWRELREGALDVAAGLIVAGVQPGDRVAIMAGDRTEHVLADLGAVHAGAVPVSLYRTFAPDQIAAVVAHAEPTVAILEGSDELARWAEAGVLGDHGTLRRVFLIEAAEDSSINAFAALGTSGAEARREHPDTVTDRIAALRPEDPATILYTSGSTGAPKGVLISHANLWFAAVGTGEAEIAAGPATLAYLPYAHITERLLGLYIPRTCGGHVHQVAADEVYDALTEVRPVMFFGVPRIWEKLASRIAAHVAALPDDEQQQARRALAVGYAWVAAQETGHNPSPSDPTQSAYDDAERAWLRPLRALVGLDRIAWAGCGGAPLPLSVSRALAEVGIALYNLYGMTETTASISTSGPGNFRIGSVGRPPEGNEVRIGGDGEIQVRGPAVTPGYFRAEELSAELFTDDGWLRTGDIGHLDDDGFLFITDRKKELIVTSLGKNIAPSAIESLLKRHPVISQALIYAEGRPYVVALLTVDPLATAGWPDEAVASAVAEAVAEANRHVSRPEQVKRYRLLPTEWAPETEELTATLKLRRRVIHAKYAADIEALYASSD